MTYIIRLQGTLAVALEQIAMREGVNAETIIAELVRQYMGDDR